MRILKDNKIDCIWSRESLLSKKKAKHWDKTFNLFAWKFQDSEDQLG